MIEESFFENENFSEEEKANTAFQIVTAMRDVLNVELQQYNAYAGNLFLENLVHYF
jgi:hypothetical protein